MWIINFIDYIFSNLSNVCYYRQTNKNIILAKRYHRITCIIIHPDGRIITGSQDSTLRIWSKFCNDAYFTMTGHTDVVTCVAILPDSRIISGSTDKTIKIWNQNTGLPDFSLNLSKPINCIKVLNKNVICGLTNGSLIKLSLPFINQRYTFLKGHQGPVNCVTTLSNGYIVSGSDDKTLRLWNPNSDQSEAIFYGHTGSVKCVSEISDGKFISGSDDKTLKIWNANNYIFTFMNDYNYIFNVECDATIISHTCSINCVKVLNGKIISSSGKYDRSIRIFNVDTYECEFVLTGHSASITCIDILSDHKIISGSLDKSIILWNIN